MRQTLAVAKSLLLVAAPFLGALLLGALLLGALTSPALGQGPRLGNHGGGHFHHGNFGQGHFHHGNFGQGLGFGYGWNSGWASSYYWYPSPYGDLAYGCGYPAGLGYWPPYDQPGPLILPPLFVPAEAAFGPGQMARFMGLDSTPLATPAAAAPRQRARGGGFGVLAGGNANPAPAKKRASNAQAVERARQFIASGDQHFRAQELARARDRYKKAAAAAPDVADAFFRQGITMLAVGQYAPAARTLKHGLVLKPDWPKSAFRLNDLYGANRLAKTSHLEALATAATNKPHDPNLMFLLGVHLYFDGQHERARLFFAKALELSDGDDRHLTPFFEAIAAAAQQKAKAAGQEL